MSAGNQLFSIAAIDQAIVHDAPCPIVATDLAGCINGFNPAAERMLGWKASELIGKASPTIFHLAAEIAARAEKLGGNAGQPVSGFETIVAGARQGQACSSEWTYVRKDGGRLPVLVQVSALRDRQGGIFGFVEMVTDITERHRAEARLRERETQYRLLFENMASGFALHEIICDETGRPIDYRYLVVNPAFERLTGLTAEKLVGRTVSEALPAVEKYWVQIFGQVALTGKPLEYENYFSDLGKYYDTWVFSPQRGQFAVVFSDVTDRKQAEESLQESRRLYAELVASVPLGVYRLVQTADGSMAFEFVSDRFCEITGVPRGIVLADAHSFYKIIHPDDFKNFTEKQNAAVQRRGPFNWEGRAVVRRETRWLHMESRPTVLAHRQPFWTGVIFDVTERRQVEQALREQHSLLEGALEATADGILAVSREGRITSYNRQFLELWRLPREVLEKNDTAALADFILPQLANPKAMQDRLRHFQDPAKSDTFDLLEFADGRVYERFSRPQIVDDRVVGRVWSYRDVTVRHTAMASLRESEQKFKMLFDSARDAIIIMDRDIFVDCNPVTESIYGCSRAELVGRSPVDFSPERQADGRMTWERVTEEVENVLAGRPRAFEWIHKRGDGTLFNAEVTLNRLELRGQTVIQAMVRDITARKQAEAAQHEAEQLYRTLVDTSPDGICLLDLKGRLLYASPKAVELFYGPEGQDALPEPNVLKFVSKQNRAHAATLFTGALTGKFPPSVRLMMRCTDGHEFVAELNGTLLRDGAGVSWGVLVILRDGTDRQRQEDELKSKNRELEHFTYTVSHDLRSPLITIKGFAGALLSDLTAGRTDRLNADLTRIVGAADKMSELLNGLLELSRIGRIVHPPMVVSMAKIAQEVVELLEGPIAERHALVTVQPGLPAAYGDPQRLREVLQNLVENALKFSLPERNPEIDIGFALTGSQTAYFVRDRGRGIEARFQQSIFGLFNKLDPRSEGAGIGLALVRRIVEFHGGTAWVESAGAGEGATFYFTLPGRKALSPPPKNTPQS